MSPKPVVLQRRAIRVVQNAETPLFLSVLTAGELMTVCDISRISRNNANKVIGYQRPEVRKHVGNILQYLDGDDVLFPNSIILALSSAVEFKQARGTKVRQGLDEGTVEVGTLRIPLPAPGKPKAAWIVDGQQRALALSLCRRPSLPVPINAFVTDEVGLQRDQFIRINSTKPLRRGLLDELLPDVSTILPAHLESRRAPAKLCEVLNSDSRSPFKGLVRFGSIPPEHRKKAVISDTVIVAMIAESLVSSSGCLYPFSNLSTRETDYDGICRVLFLFWSAVRDTFPEAWGLPLDRSRLMHGSGIRAMGRLMNWVMPEVNPNSPKARERVMRALAKVRPHCRWTGGTWEGVENTRWDRFQNTPQDIERLSSYLIRVFQARRLGVA